MVRKPEQIYFLKPEVAGTAIGEGASMNLAAIDSFSPPGPIPVYRDRFQPR